MDITIPKKTHRGKSHKRSKSSEGYKRNKSTLKRSSSMPILPSQTKCLTEFIKHHDIINTQVEGVFKLEGSSDDVHGVTPRTHPDVEVLHTYPLLLTPHKEIDIHGLVLNYRTYHNEYIITYLTNYSEEFDEKIKRIYYGCVKHLHSIGTLKYSNVCGQNSEKLCSFINNKYNSDDTIQAGKLIIVNWKHENVHGVKLEELLKPIKKVYGPPNQTIGVMYHALTYIVVDCSDNRYFVAVETTLNTPYKDQFYVGSSPEELRDILLTRYMCNNVIYTFNCDKVWTDIYRGATPRTNLMGREVNQGYNITLGGSKKYRKKLFGTKKHKGRNKPKREIYK